MLKLRIREYSPTGVKGRILPVVDDTLEVTTQLNGTPTISFALSKIMSGKMPDDGFVVGVEYGVGNGRYKPLPQHDMFIITNYDWDDTEPTQVVSYSGMSYVIWLMGMTYLHWSEYAVNNERLWTETGHPASPGTIVGGMIHEAKLRGWGSQVSTDFTWDKDSNNVAWTADDKILQKYRLLTPITEVLESLVTGGLCDWTVEGLKLRMFRPDTLGADKTNLVITRSESKPIKTDMSEIFTNLTVVPDEATHWLYLDNPGAPSKYGRLEATMTQSGIDNHTEATKLAQPTLLKGRHTTREEAFQYHPNQGQLIPWEDFSIGDKVTVLVAGEKVTRRVIGLVAKTDQGNTSVRVIVGDPITSVSRKILDRVGAASVGGIIGGSGNSFPGSTGPSPLAPENPDNLRVTSNTSEWLDDGSAASTVKLEWEPVTRAIDGSSAIIQEYEVWARRNSEQFTRVTAVINPEATISIWEPGIDRIVRVRALSTNGQWSEFSLDLALTPSVPTSVVPAAPGKPVLVSNVGSFTAAGPVAAVTLTIPVVTLSTDGEPIEVAEYELWDADGPLFRLPASPAKVTIPSDVVRVYRARAGTAQGVWGDLSESLSVTGAKPAVVVRNPTAPVLTTGAGNAFARWEGTYVSGGTLGAHSVRVEARVGSSGSWIAQGTLTSAGEQIVTVGAVGDTVQVRFLAYDQLGRLTGTSSVASIVVAGIDRVDFDTALDTYLDGIETDITEAQAAADAAQAAADAARGGSANLIGNPSFVLPQPGAAGGGTHWVKNGTGGRIIDVGNGVYYLAIGFDFTEGAVAEAGSWSTFFVTNNQLEIVTTGRTYEVIAKAQGAVAVNATIELLYGSTVVANAPFVSEGSGQLSARLTYTHNTSPVNMRVRINVPMTDGTYDKYIVVSRVDAYDITNATEAQARADEAFDEAVAAATAAGIAQATADGKNRVWYQGTAPAGTGHKVDDVWFNTSLGHQMARWDGSNWVVTQLGTNAIANLAITNALIANGTIQNAKIANLDAGKITTGTLNAGRIAANSISAQKLLLTSLNNLAQDSSFEYNNTEAWQMVANSANETTNPRTGSRALRVTTTTSAFVAARQVAMSSVAEGERYRVSAWVRLDSGTSANNGITLRFAYASTEGGSTTSASDVALTPTGTGTTYVQISGIWTVPAAAKFARLEVISRETVAGKIYRVDDVEVYKMATSELIVDGAVKARHVEMDTAFADKFWANEGNFGKIQVDMVAPNFGDTLNLGGNAVAINLNSRADDVEVSIEQTQQSADDAQAAADAAAGAADAANQAVETLAAGRVLTAEAALGALSDKIDDYDNSFLFLSDGLHIRESKTTSAEMVLTSAGARLIADGVIASEWNQGQMIVPQIVATGGQIANHIIDSTIAGHTIWRAIS